MKKRRFYILSVFLLAFIMNAASLHAYSADYPVTPPPTLRQSASHFFEKAKDIPYLVGGGLASVASSYSDAVNTQKASFFSSLRTAVLDFLGFTEEGTEVPAPAPLPVPSPISSSPSSVPLSAPVSRPTYVTNVYPAAETTIIREVRTGSTSGLSRSVSENNDALEARIEVLETDLSGITSFSTTTARSLFSSSATGLTYATSTGDFSLTSGYTIPLTASTTAWEAKVSSQWTTSGSDVYYNTGNVGVGTSTPSAKFAVTGTAGTGDIFALASSTEARLLTFTSTGRLGIGQSAPTGLLEVKGSSGSMILDTTGTSLTFTRTATNYIYASSVGGSLAFGSNGSTADMNLASGRLTLGNGNNALASKFNIKGSDSTSSNSSLNVIDAANSPLLFVRNDGNVGIGTSSPSYKLHISSSGENGLMLQNTTGGGGVQSNLDFLTYGEGYEAYPSSRIAAIDDGSYSNHLIFSTKDVGTPTNSLIERLRITSSGSVGIGTNNPSYALDVNGALGNSSSGTWNIDTSGVFTGSLSSGIQVYANNVGGYDSLVNNGNGRFFDAGGYANNANYANYANYAYYVDSGTSVYLSGLGSSEYLVNSNNARLFDTNGYANNANYAGNATYAGSGGQLYYYNNNALTDSSSYLFYSNGNTLADSGGNLYAGGYQIANSSGQLTYSNGNVFTDTSNNLYYSNGYTLADSSGDLYDGRNSGASFLDSTHLNLRGRYISNDGGDEGIVIDNDGNVGIGTTSPGGKLDIQGNNLIVGSDNGADTRTNLTVKSFRLGVYNYTNAEEPVGVFFVNQGSAGTASLNFGGGSSTLNAAASISFYTGASNVVTGTQRMVIDVNGNVGIGTASPSNKFHVVESRSTNLTGNNMSLYVDTTYTPTSNETTYTNRGALFSSSKAGAFNSLDVRGVQGQASNQGSGNITNLYGVMGGVTNSSTGVVTNGYSFHAVAPSASALNPITNAYGFYTAAQTQTGVTNGYGFYSAGASDKNYFAGNVGIGITAPTSKLHVVETQGTLTANNTGSIFSAHTYTPVADSAFTDSGAYFQVTKTGSVNLTSSPVRASVSDAVNTGTGNIASMSGAESTIRNTAASTITNGYAFRAATPQSSATNIITNLYGFYANAQTQTGVTNGYGFYSAGASDLNYFAGNVGVGTTTPTLGGTTKSIRLAGLTNATISMVGQKDWQISSVSDGTFTFYNATDNISAFKLSTGGNMGINIGASGSPSHRFQVMEYSAAGSPAKAFAISNNNATVNSSVEMIYQMYSTGTTWAEFAKTGVVGTAVGASAQTGDWYVSTANTGTVAERLRVTGAGNIGIGTTTPSAQLTTTGTVQFAALGSGGGNLITDALGNVTVSSDERLKDTQGDFTRSLEDLMKIQPISYKWKASTGYDTGSTYTGFSAQNIQLAIPEAVSEDSRGFLTLADRPILGTLVNAVKEIGSVFEKIEDGVAYLKNIFVKKVTTEELCIGDDVDSVCVTKEQLRDILEAANVSSTTPTPSPDPEPENDPEEESESEPATETENESGETSEGSEEESVEEEVPLEEPVETEEVAEEEPEPEPEPQSEPEAESSEPVDF